MAIQIQLRQGTTTEHDTFTGAVGEVTVDTGKKTVVVHDGVTVGGHPLLKASEATPVATETVAGKAKIATTAIAQGGTNDTDIITPLKLKNTIFGFGQNRKVVTKISGTTYTNTTGKPIGFEVIFKSLAGAFAIMDSNITVNSEIRQRLVWVGGDPNYRCSMFVIVLPNESYSFNAVTLSSIEKVTEIS